MRRARRGAGRGRLGSGRRDARPGDRGRLRRGGRAAAQTWPAASAGRRSRRSSRSTPACRRATARRARWSWPPTATTPRSCGACTSSSARSASTRSGSRPASCRRAEPGLSPRVRRRRAGATGDAQADPRATRARARRGGEEIASATEVARRSSTTAGGSPACAPADGRSIAAGAVVVAAGAWTARARAGAAPPVRPVKGQILELRVRGRRRRAARPDRAHAALLPGGRGDGRVVLGATVEEQGFDTTRHRRRRHRLLEAAWEVLPGDRASWSWCERAAGLRPGTPDNLPRDRARASRGTPLGHRPLAQRRAAGAAHRRGGGRAARRRATRRPSCRGLGPAALRARGGGRSVTAVTINGEPHELPAGATVEHARARVRGGRRRAAAWPWRWTARWCPRGEWAATPTARRAAGRGAAGGAGRATAGPEIAGRRAQLAPGPRHRRLPQPRGDGRGRARPPAPSWPPSRCAAWTRRRPARSSRCWRVPGSRCCPTPPAASPPARP